MAKTNPIDKEQAVNTILSRLALGESLRSILPEEKRDKSLPAKNTFLSWVSENEDLATQYAHAREEGAEVKAEEMETIAVKAKDMVDVAKARLIIDARKWNLSKMFPKKYGDRVENLNKNQTLDKDGNPIDPKVEHTIIIRKAKGKECPE